MGNGLYTLLGWGCLEPPCTDDGRDDDIECVMSTLGVRLANEAAPDYLVVPLAVDDLPLQVWWHLPDLPDWVGQAAARTAGYLDATPEQLAALGPAWREARATWLEVQNVYAEAGLDLPDARLVLLSDWD